MSSADCLTAHEIADRFANIIGKPVKAEEVPAAEFFIKHRKHPLVEAKLAAGETVTAEHFPREFEVFQAIGACYAKYDFIGNPNVLTWLLGREPTSVEQYLRREYAWLVAPA